MRPRRPSASRAWKAPPDHQRVLQVQAIRSYGNLVHRLDGAPLAQWQTERRDLGADFLRAFGDETSTVPTLNAVVVGADADNTGPDTLGHVAGLELLPR